MLSTCLDRWYSGKTYFVVLFSVTTTSANLFRSLVADFWHSFSWQNACLGRDYAPFKRLLVAGKVILSHGRRVKSVERASRRSEGLKEVG